MLVQEDNVYSDISEPCFDDPSGEVYMDVDASPVDVQNDTGNVNEQNDTGYGDAQDDDYEAEDEISWYDPYYKEWG